MTSPPRHSADGAERRRRSTTEARSGGLLFVLAHPDDETFLCGGTIARYASAGLPVHFLCATRGECGTVAPGSHASRSIADLRTAELACAASALGLDAVHFLGYRDSGMPGSSAADHPRAFVKAPIDECTGKIATLIRDLRPRIVVTHGPYGEYGHPDHIRLHTATCRAFRLAGDEAGGASLALAPWSPEALFCTGFNPRRIRLAVRLLRLLRRDPRRFGENADLDLVAIADHVPPVTCAVAVGPWLALRDRAFRCYQSQLGAQRYPLLLPRALRRRFVGRESYARVIPSPRPGEPLYRDLIVASRPDRV